jgi:hypothetical protein
MSPQGAQRQLINRSALLWIDSEEHISHEGFFASSKEGAFVAFSV